MIESISKPRPPKGLSYVLKTSQLAKALSDAGIDCRVDLNFWVPQGGGSILEGNYWLPNQNVPHPRVYVRAGVVPNALRSAASDALVETALPKLIKWLLDILALPHGSTALHRSPYFNAEYTESGLVVAYQPKYKVIRGR